ncbi:GNAT family N-acetyltransferase [Albibacterium profundi]|uniref:GNAT family N-acetyltransferase n=1 Tax=Albibacterium profundi TaxID=3134906 RepID=A0ABV5CG55_9SPHI
MGIQIRKARIDDCPRLLELIKELAEYEQAPNEVTVSMDEFEAAGFGPDAVWKAYVADVDGRIEGMALYYIRYSTWKGRRLYLEDIIVTEKQRGKGLGKLLFDKVLDLSKEKGYSGMVWQVLDWNEPAIKFYKNYGAAIEDGWLNASVTHHN